MIEFYDLKVCLHFLAIFCSFQCRDLRHLFSDLSLSVSELSYYCICYLTDLQFPLDRCDHVEVQMVPYILISYPPNLLSSLINSSRRVVESIGLPPHTLSCLLETKTVLLLPFKSGCLFFLFLALLH